MKHEIFKIILATNNENMNNVNYTKFITPITRISVSVYVLFYDIVSTIIPSIAFLSIISLYFLYNDVAFGLSFLIANMCIGFYIAHYWNDFIDHKRKHESSVNNTEKYILDVLNNIDKVIYRGQTGNEIGVLEQKIDTCVHDSISMLNHASAHTSLMAVYVNTIIFASIGYLIQSRYKNKITTTIFITFFTILLSYRDRILHPIENLPDYMEFIGRLQYITEDFNKMFHSKLNLSKMLETKYGVVDLDFNHIKFENVGFTYASKTEPVFDNLNIDLNTRNKIVGITGLSGKGKSSFAKLLLKIYDCTSGRIWVDGKDIKDIDPDYIRQNITYVNQNSKLFDIKVIENIMYGCSDTNACNGHLEEILKYSKIQGLFNNIDIHTNMAGSLGENLSGGQRQVVNVISGLINPSKILILDEPTNALDPDLKREVIGIISHFRKYKKCIIIISHDKDIYSLFDETLNI